MCEDGHEKPVQKCPTSDSSNLKSIEAVADLAGEVSFRNFHEPTSVADEVHSGPITFRRGEADTDKPQ